MTNRNAKIDIKISQETLEKLDKIISNMYNSSMLKSIGILESEKLEMANMTQKLNETRITGEIRNGYIVLDKSFNEVKSWKLDRKYMNRFSQNDKVIVVFQDRKIVDIFETTVESVDEKSQEKPKTKLIPKHCFYVNDEQQKTLDFATKAFNDQTNPYKGFVIGLTGEAGYGKTSIAQYFAQTNNLPILIIDCATIPDNENWFVVPEFKNHETQFTPTKFTDFLRMGNCVILFDELNRMPTWVSNALLPILDHRRFTSVRNVDVVANGNIAFFATENQGSDYAGTNPIDKALRRRMLGVLKVGVLPELVETELLETRMKIEYELAKNIVKIFTSLRSSELKEYPVNISTSTSLNVAWWVKYGATIREAFTLAILNDAPEESHKIIIDRLNILGYA